MTVARQLTLVSTSDVKCRQLASAVHCALGRPDTHEQDIYCLSRCPRLGIHASQPSNPMLPLLQGAELVYTRDELISICEQAIVPQHDWHNRDSQRSQAHVGKCWALLKANCNYRVCDRLEDEPCRTDDKTIWLEVDSEGFQYYEIGELRTDTFYLPTPARLAAVAGKDWY